MLAAAGSVRGHLNCEQAAPAGVTSSFPSLSGPPLARSHHTWHGFLVSKKSSLLFPDVSIFFFDTLKLGQDQPVHAVVVEACLTNS